MINQNPYGLKNKLAELIGQGKIRQALRQLNNLDVDNFDLKARIVALSGRFEKYHMDKHSGMVDDDKLDIKLNRINAAALNLIEQLPEDSKDHKKKWPFQSLALWGATIVGVMLITVFSLNAILNSRSEQVNNRNLLENSTKNNINIEVKDQAEVGDIYIGDSNDIKK